MYANASVIVSAFVQEVNSGAARAWLFELEPGELMSSWWCVTEVGSAIAAKIRRREVPIDEGQRYFDVTRELLTGSAVVLTVEQRHFALAADLAKRCGPPLRSGDALHLAIATDAGATLCTLDRRMAEAGKALGLRARLLP